MTQLLKKAIKEVEKLSEADQDAVAALVLEELQSERRWSEAFDKSPDLLAKLAQDALAEDAAGRTKPL